MEQGPSGALSMEPPFPSPPLPPGVVVSSPCQDNDPAAGGGGGRAGGEGGGGAARHLRWYQREAEWGSNPPQRYGTLHNTACPQPFGTVNMSKIAPSSEHGGGGGGVTAK